MAESNHIELQDRRFKISETSLDLMKSLRDNLTDVQKAIPQVKGLGFFGSRTLELEESTSDLDMVVFYDGSAFPVEIYEDPVDLLEAGLEVKDGQVIFNKQLVEQRRHMGMLITHARSKFEGQIQSNYVKFLESRLDLQEVEQLRSQRKSIAIVDISQEATDAVLSIFIDEILRPFFDHDRPSENTIKLLSRFFLCVGDEVYRNRKYILDKLEKHERGEGCFKGLMAYLRAFERTRDVSEKKRKVKITYAHYPQSIAEAREYFITKE